MQINIKSTDLELTDALKDFIDEKVGSLEKFVQNIGDDGHSDGHSPTVEIFVEVSRTTNHHKKGDVFCAEIRMPLPGTDGVIVRAEEWDIHRAIDRARDDMQRRLKKYKGKRRAKFFRGALKMKNLSRINPLARFRGEK